VPIVSFNRPGPRFDRVEVYSAPTRAEALRNTMGIYGESPPSVLGSTWFPPASPGRQSHDWMTSELTDGR
jgi:hypothetical protein